MYIHMNVARTWIIIIAIYVKYFAWLVFLFSTTMRHCKVWVFYYLFSRIHAGVAGYVSLDTPDTISFGLWCSGHKWEDFWFWVFSLAPVWVICEYLIHPRDKIRRRNHKDIEAEGACHSWCSAGLRQWRPQGNFQNVLVWGLFERIIPLGDMGVEGGALI